MIWILASYVAKATLELVPWAMGTDVVLSRHGGAGSQVPVTGPGAFSLLVPTLATLVILALSHVLVLLLNIGSTNR